jgi:hypothetical protein
MAIIARKIRFRRNAVLHGIFNHPLQVIREATKSLSSFKSITNVSTEGTQLAHAQQPVTWQCPPPRLYKVNWDVAADNK